MSGERLNAIGNRFTELLVRNAAGRTCDLGGNSCQMKVFISSVIAEFGPMRDAAKTAVLTLRHHPVMAEDFGAQPQSPQVACLNGLRASDLVVLILGHSYGPIQTGSQLSATHEEYRDAQGRKPVIAFVQDGQATDPKQQAFIAEVEGWEAGLFRGSFSDATELQAGVTRALHDYEMASSVAPENPSALVERALRVLPSEDRHSGHQGAPFVSLGVVGGPAQKVLRPVEIEAAELRDWIHKTALFGTARIFEGEKGVRTEIENSALVLEQKDRGARVQLDEDGSILLRLPIAQPRREERTSGFGFSTLIEEDVQRCVAAGLAFAAALLENIDPTQRLTHVALAARINASDYMGWRTQAEQDASPNSGTINMGRNDDRQAVTVSRGRAALRLNTASIVEDIVVPLRRSWKSR